MSFWQNLKDIHFVIFDKADIRSAAEDKQLEDIYWVTLFDIGDMQ